MNHIFWYVVAALHSSILITVMSSSLVGGDPIQPPPAMWTFNDELHLLQSVLEISAEPAESYDPGISLFDRIKKHLRRGAFSRTEILEKVKEFKRRYENGGDLGGNGEFVEICKNIWGSGRKRKDLEKKMWIGKKKKKDHISKLQDDGSRQVNNGLHPHEHFLAILSSSWAERQRLGSCQNLQSSQNSFRLSSSDSGFITKSSLKLTENIDNVKLKQSSMLVLTALNDVSQQHEDQYQEEPVEKFSQTVAQPLNDGVFKSQSHEPDLPPHDKEPYKRKMLAKSSCEIAEKRLRLALQACTSGEGALWASSAFSVSNDVTYQPCENSEESLSTNVFASSPFVDEYLNLETLNDMDVDEFDPLSVLEC